MGADANLLEPGAGRTTLEERCAFAWLLWPQRLAGKTKTGFAETDTEPKDDRPTPWVGAP